jgi:hypothetical protein
MSCSRSTSAIFYTIIKLTLVDRHEVHVTLKRSLSSLFLRPSTPHTRPHDYHPLRILSNRPPFRASYMLSEFHAPSYYGARFLLERIRAINCPSLPLQLAGGRGGLASTRAPWHTQVLPGEREYDIKCRLIDLTAYATDIPGTWMGMWALDSEDADIIAVLSYLRSDSSISGQEGEPPGTHLAHIKAQSLVLKLQREGGGNNVYREASPQCVHGESTCRRA